MVEALLGMERDNVVSPFFSPNIGEDKKKLVVFGPNELETQQKKKQGLYYKSVELWFHIIVWCHPKWWHPKKVSPWAAAFSPAPPPPPGDATETWLFVEAWKQGRKKRGN